MSRELDQEEIRRLQELCKNQKDDFWEMIASLFTKVSEITGFDTDELGIFTEGPDVIVSRIEDISYEPQIITDLVRITVTDNPKLNPLERVKHVALTKEQRKDREERNRCLDPINGMEYFYRNYFLIDGRKPELTNADIELFNIYRKASAKNRHVIINRRRTGDSLFIGDNDGYADNDIVKNPVKPSDAFYMPSFSGNMMYYGMTFYLDGDDPIFRSSANLNCTFDVNVKPGSIFIGRTSHMIYEVFELPGIDNSVQNTFNLKVVHRMGNQDRLKRALEEDNELYQIKDWRPDVVNTIIKNFQLLDSTP